MTPETGPSPLTVARRRDVNTRRARVAQALDAMRAEGSEITIQDASPTAHVPAGSEMGIVMHSRCFR